MADITFNGTDRIITVNSGVTVLDAQTLYSWWKQWAALANNSKYLQAFRPVGGDAIGGGALAPMYFFLLNGWKIRPYDADHVLTVSYNIYVDGGGNPYMATLGSHQVLVQSKVSDTPVFQLAGGSALTSEEHNKLMAVPVATDNAAATWEKVVDSGFTAEQILRLIGSATAGKLSGADGTTINIRDLRDTKDRISATVDASGNRTAVTLDAS